MIAKRSNAVMMVSWLFFGALLVGAFFGQAQIVWDVFKWPSKTAFPTNNLPLLVLWIFLFNLLWSSLVLLTLSGFVFFAVPLVIMTYRAWLWGVLLANLPISLFWVVIPVLVVEGEAYVLSCVAGVNLGLALLRPNMIFKEEGISRLQAVKRAFKECAYFYIFVAVLLLAAAIIEALLLGTAF